MSVIRKIIRRIIEEHVEVGNLSLTVAQDVVDVIKRQYDKINDGSTWELISTTKTNNIIKDATKIEIVKCQIDFTYSGTIKVGGKFRQGRTKLLDSGYYEASLLIEINTNDLNNLVDRIESVTSHELNHAFVYIKQLHKKSKTVVLNKVQNFTKSELIDILKENSTLKEFTTMLYLSLPQEISARVQQTATELKQLNYEDYNETVEALMQFNPINDARRMMNYNLEDIRKQDPELLKMFVDKFNSNIKLFDTGESVKIVSEPDVFFKHWAKLINWGGHKLFRKIMRLVAEKHNVSEGVLFTEMDSSLLKKISGEFFVLD